MDAPSFTASRRFGFALLAFALAAPSAGCDEVEAAAEQLPEFDDDSAGVADVRSTAVATSKENPALVAVDADTVYFSGREGIFSVPKNGGEPRLLSPGASPNASTHLAVDAKNLYFAAIGSIVAVDKSTGEQKKLASEPDVNDVAVGGDRLYFVAGDLLSTEAKGVVGSMKTDGTGRTVLDGQGLFAPLAIALDASSLYFVDRTAGTVNRLSREGGGGPTVIAKDVVQPKGIALDGDRVVWMTWENGSDGAAPGANGIYAASKEGGAAKELYKGDKWLRHLAVAGGKAYFYKVGSGVWRVPVNGGAVEKFAKAHAGGIAGDETATWYSDARRRTADSSVRRAAP